MNKIKITDKHRANARHHVPTSTVYGRRGKGGHLGFSFSQAIDFAKEQNKAVGWGINKPTIIPKFKVWC